ncbi:hypothetical protein ACVIHH_000255 [Bradyrhizobium sp. USDA 4518]
MFGEVIKSLRVGIKRRWLTGIGQALSAAGAIWLITEITTKVSDPADQWIKHHGDIYTAIVLGVAAVWFLRHVYEVRSVSFNLPTTDTKIEIRYGDLFAQPTDWLIGVGEFFDSAVGDVVSQHSLHGKLIINTYNGNTTTFRSLVDQALIGADGTHMQRSIQPKVRYSIGTTAVLARDPHKVFLVAMSRTDLTTFKASSDVPTLWQALSGALTSVRNHGNGRPLSLPLIGNGRSSVNIEPQHLLRLIVLALVDFGRKHDLPKQVHIVVPEDCFDALDIREIRRDWRRR